MLTSDFDYELPPDRIAQTPIEPRDHARLLVLNRSDGSLLQRHFYDLPEFLHPGDLLVLNETRVIPARLYAHKLDTRGKVELLLLRRLDELSWETLVGGKGMRVGRRLEIDESGPPRLQAEITAVLDGSRRVVRFDEPVEQHLTSAGRTPLPPYIHTPLSNPERYQTVYSHTPGSAAAPTAGLHFTPQLLQTLHLRGVGVATVTLHVGLDTFAPVTEEHADQHVIHTEWCGLPPETAQAIRQARRAGGRIAAVGTTSVRTLESAAQLAASHEVVRPFEGPTGLYILPGYTFRAVDVMITNFHLPKSTLVMLVSAFAGRERILNAYRTAIAEQFRFYSFGDAMLIL